jgi:hypothetical protein
MRAASSSSNYLGTSVKYSRLYLQACQIPVQLNAALGCESIPTAYHLFTRATGRGTNYR